MGFGYNVSGKIMNLLSCTKMDITAATQRLVSITGLDTYYQTNAINPLDFLSSCPVPIDWNYHEELLALSKEFPRIKFRFEIVDEEDHCWREYYWNGQYARDDGLVASVVFDNPPTWANETEDIAYVRW